MNDWWKGKLVNEASDEQDTYPNPQLIYESNWTRGP
jgi:hypothetical protein